MSQFFINLWAWIVVKVASALHAFGRWKASQGPEADALHVLISYSVITTGYWKFHVNPWYTAVPMAVIAVLLEVYDHFYEPPHPVWQDIEDVLFYWSGIGFALSVALL